MAAYVWGAIYLCYIMYLRYTNHLNYKAQFRAWRVCFYENSIPNANTSNIKKFR